VFRNRPVALLLVGMLCFGSTSCDSPFDSSDRSMDYVVHGRAIPSGNPDIGVPDVKVSVFGLKSDGYSYIMTSTLTDAEGFYSVSFRGRVTDCPDSHPGSKPPGYHVTATKEGLIGTHFTAICGASPQEWDPVLRADMPDWLRL